MASESLKDLRRRVRSIRNLQQITRAMEMVSAAKLRRAQANMHAGSPYAAKLMELAARLAEGSELGAHPLFVPREGKRKVLVLYTSDRGYCGSYNGNAIKMAEDALRSEPDAQWKIVAIGKRGFDYFSKRRWPIIESCMGLGGQASVAEAQRIAKFLVGLYLENQVDSIWLLYQAFISSVLSRPKLVRYLGLTPEALGLGKGGAPAKKEKGSSRVDYILEPSAQEVFDALLPRYLASRIYITMAEAAASEHSARMVAMNSATKNCKEVANALTLKMNNARQAAITKELLEIVSGANAIQG